MRCLGTATAQSSHTSEEGSLFRVDTIIENRFEVHMSGIRSICVTAVCKRCAALTSRYETPKSRAERPSPGRLGWGSICYTLSFVWEAQAEGMFAACAGAANFLYAPSSCRRTPPPACL